MGVWRGNVPRPPARCVSHPINGSRAMAEKFIPNADRAFCLMAIKFRSAVLRDYVRYRLTKSDADALDTAVSAFVAAFEECRRPGAKNALCVGRKNETRRWAEEQIRR